jgi:Protein of unknown function (DUF2281)
MLTAISGTIENGQIYFDEQLPNKKGKVILMFVDEFMDKKPSQYKSAIRFGGLESMVSLPDDFNEPLADLNEYM